MGSCASSPAPVQQQQPAKSDDKMDTKASCPKSETNATETNVVIVAEGDSAKTEDKKEDPKADAAEEPKVEAEAEVKSEEVVAASTEEVVAASTEEVVAAPTEEVVAAPTEEAAEAKPEDASAVEVAPVVVADAVTVSDADLDILFTKAHTANGFQDKIVEDSLLEKAMALAQLAPTAFNSCPLRVVFVKSTEGKEKLGKCLMEGNVAKTLEAPVCAIVCVDHKFYEHLDTLCPAIPGLKEKFSSNPTSAEGSLTRNGNLQGGYFILALRSVGLDCGPMSGFDNAAVDAAFLEGTEWKSNFLINIGYGVPEKSYPRAPRLAFDVASQFA